ncbi:MAG: aminotransferase class V-fold PLP-dependent enzyme [Gemmatimonadetes bacterium]|nr:aminotransferase class V-fold PLP-dependent enzyme [Gemmatimonadota bacterium]
MTESHEHTSGISRRKFAQLLAVSGSAALLPAAELRALERPRGAVPGAPPSADDSFWTLVRGQFALDDDLTFLNAANLCPSSRPVIETLYQRARDLDRDPSPDTKERLIAQREETRRLLAEYLRVSPEEILLTRNTSEANNIVSSGLALKPGDEVVISADNHPSNHRAWTEKAKRFGFSVTVVDAVTPHPGPEYYLEAFRKAVTPRTRLVAFTHVTSTVGDGFPANELCALARERGALSLVDGAQTFGVLDVDLSQMQPDFYTGSGHKWPCAPRGTGVLYVRRTAQAALSPSIISLYPGSVGISRSHEGIGQRDEPAMIAFGQALRMQMTIGRPAIESHARELSQALIAGLSSTGGVKVWTHSDPARSASIVAFQPASLDPRRLARALYENHRITAQVRGGEDRPGLRLSPHLYNTHADVERTLAAVRRYLTSGV